MKVRVEISNEYVEPHAVIYTDKMTDEIQHVIDIFGMSESPIIAMKEDDLVILQPKDIYMVRVENGDTIIYGMQQKYYSKKTSLMKLGSNLVNNLCKYRNQL